MRDGFPAIRRLLNLIDPGLNGPVMQPVPQFPDRGGRALREHLDGTVRQVACEAAQAQPIGFEPGTVAKVHALNFPTDEKTADSRIQGYSVRWSRGRFGMLRIRARERGGGVTLGLQRRQASPREFLRLEMGLRARDG